MILQVNNLVLYLWNFYRMKRKTNVLLLLFLHLSILRFFFIYQFLIFGNFSTSFSTSYFPGPLFFFFYTLTQTITQETNSSKMYVILCWSPYYCRSCEKAQKIKSKKLKNQYRRTKEHFFSIVFFSKSQKRTQLIQFFCWNVFVHYPCILNLFFVLLSFLQDFLKRAKRAASLNWISFRNVI